MDPDGNEPLVAYLTGVAGRSCTLPFDRIQDLTRATSHGAAALPGWWTEPDGQAAKAASQACLAAGWRFESVHPSAGLVRFVRVAGAAIGEDARGTTTAPPRRSGRRATRWTDKVKAWLVVRFFN